MSAREAGRQYRLDEERAWKKANPTKIAYLPFWDEENVKPMKKIKDKAFEKGLEEGLSRGVAIGKLAENKRGRKGLMELLGKVDEFKESITDQQYIEFCAIVKDFAKCELTDTERQQLWDTWNSE